MQGNTKRRVLFTAEEEAMMEGNDQNFKCFFLQNMYSFGQNKNDLAGRRL
jgi:hypothetical protein